MKRLLICTLGLTPGVVTGAYFMLEREGYGRMDKVISVTTNSTAAASCEAEIHKVFAGLDSQPEYQPVRALQTERLADFKATTHVTEKMESLLRENSRDFEDIYLILTGGRKSMAAAMMIAVQRFNAFKTKKETACFHIFHLEVTDDDLEEKGRIDKLPVNRDKRMEFLIPPENALALVEVPIFTHSKDPDDLWAHLFEYAVGAYLSDKEAFQQIRFSYYPPYLREPGLGEIDVYAKKMDPHLLDTVESVDNAVLRKLMERSFSLEELHNLLFDLDVNYEEISGDTLSAFVREMILYFQRQQRLGEMIDACRRARPREAWQDAVRLRQIVVCECKLRINNPDKPITVQEVRKLTNKVTAVHEQTMHPTRGWLVSNNQAVEMDAWELAQAEEIRLFQADLPNNWKERADWKVQRITPLTEPG